MNKNNAFTIKKISLVFSLKYLRDELKTLLYKNINNKILVNYCPF